MANSTSKKSLRDEIRANYLAFISSFLNNRGEEVLETASNEIAIPVVDSEGNELFVVVTVKVPTGSRDGEAYDGYSMAEEYRLKQVDKELKAKERAEAKAKKIAKDKAAREAKAKAKAEKEGA